MAQWWVQDTEDEMRIICMCPREHDARMIADALNSPNKELSGNINSTAPEAAQGGQSAKIRRLTVALEKVVLYGGSYSSLAARKALEHENEKEANHD